MNKKQLNHYKKIIMRKRQELIEQLNKLKESGLNNSVSDSAGDHSTYSLHMADQGTDTMEREKQYMFASREQNYLYHLDMALERIEKGEFGKCINCGNEIGQDRLEAVPHVRLCINCKSKEELTKSKY
ncbi:TraR/DksA C4-type zinc finger protein [candidate division KSB1 bacterium]|nr:TraR/DksA C4-type zinc finger protein [candidate division KSB1 bacterium]RQW11423.1 MAG: TraR/DksA family transcriptional regulator [candidate division KSB1 bacterium]